VIWIKAGGSYDSVRLAVDLATAVHARRRDLRVVLTFEEGYPTALLPLRHLPRAMIGYGPCDIRSAIRRFLKRLDPLGVLLVDTGVGPNLMDALRQIGCRVGAVHVEYPGPGYFDAVLPRDGASRQRMAGHGEHVGVLVDSADGIAMLVEPHASPSLKLLSGEGERGTFWWWQDETSEHLDALQRYWSAFASEMRGVLVFGGAVGESARRLWSCSPVIPLSQWNRRALPAASVLLIDDPRWYVAAAAAADGVHIVGAARGTIWQCAAMGVTMSFGPAMAGSPCVEFARASTDDPVAILDLWRRYPSLAVENRALADRARRRFWQERRRARSVFQELLDLVFTW
jgi:hypothetical protein